MRKNKPFLIFQLRPEDETADSEYACMLKYGGLHEDQTRRMRIEATGIPEDLNLDDYAAIIVGGSPFDITTPEDEKSDIQKKIEADFMTLLKDVVERDFPFLGCCSGNGLLGKYLGTAITRQYGEPISLITADLTPEGKEDKLLKGLPDEIDILVGHKEAVDETPKGAVMLVKGRVCPVQMFRVGENVYATQFHPEADAAEFQLRIDIYKHHGYFAPEDAAHYKANVAKRPTPYAQEILRRFVEIYY